MENTEHYQKLAKDILEKIKYLTLATVSEEGIPWNSPVWYSHDENFNFYFGSHKDSQHAKNIRTNGRGFVVIYNSSATAEDAYGVYFTAEIKELSEIEMVNAMKILFKESPDVKPTDLLKLGLRLYQVTPKEVWMNDADKKGDFYVDYRVAIKLS